MMANTKTYLMLSVAMIAMTAASCKKDDHGKTPLPEKKVMVTTIAGDGSDAFADGPALSAKFHWPFDVAVVADGTIYVTDFSNHRVRKIAGGQVSTLAGNDTSGVKNGNGVLAQFKFPYRLAVDATGNIYVHDQVDTRIRRISLSADVSFYAGSDQPGFLNGDAATARFEDNAAGIAADGSGNVYIGDTFNYCIRKVSADGQVTTFAGGIEGFRDGDAAKAQFRYPGGVTCDANGNVYVADAGNFSIRKISAAGVVTTLAGNGDRGTGDGVGRSAQFSIIGDMAADKDGNLYVTDDQRIRKITAQGVVTTIAGSTPGYADGEGSLAKFNDPLGLGIDAHGNIYVADLNNNRIRKISFQ